MSGEWQVGQVVIRRDVIEGRRRSAGVLERVTIVKVGRKLLHVEYFGRVETYTMSGKRNDAYGHSWLQTEERHEADTAHLAAVVRVRDLGIRFEYGCRTLSTETLHALADLIEAEVTP